MVQVILLALTCFYSPVYSAATDLESWVFHNHSSRRLTILSTSIDRLKPFHRRL